MCGIGGILRVWTPEQRDLALRTPHGESIPEAWLDILDDAVKHRGPDGQGRFRDRAIRADGCVVDVAFIHRRLSIIDHAGGHQPMVLQVPKGALSASSGSGAGGRPTPGRLLSAEELGAHNRFILAEAHVATGTDPELALGALSSQDRIAVVFNGCIYNHRELRAELQRAGHVFSTDHSDTEVLVHGWREWREQLFGRLNGMFAAVIWDANSGSLAIARDSLGEKPLYLYHASIGHSWVNVFASIPPEATALVRTLGPGAAPVDPQFHYVDWVRLGYAQASPIPGARSTSPGTAMLYRPAPSPLSACGDFEGNTRLLAPIAVPFGPLEIDGEFGHPRRDDSLSVEEADRLINGAVAARIEADVPLGCFLSGGVDSSLIAHYAKQHLGVLDTFSVRMPVAEYDESRFAETAAVAIGTSHTTLDCRPKPCDDLLALIRQIGLPFGDSSLLPATWVSRAAREHVAVALTGDGGDEMFIGYERYLAAGHTAQRIPGAGALGRAIGWRAHPKSARAKAARFLDASAHAGYWDLVSVFPSSQLNQLVRDKAALERDRAWSQLRPHTWNADYAVLLDVCNYLPEDLFRKSDAASMSVALELRAPMVDPELAHACLRARVGSLLPHGQRKGLLRQVARKYLPAEIVDRPKLGFAIPIGEWFRSDYGGLRTMLLDHLNSTEPFGPPSLGIDLNMAFIRQMLDEHLGTGPSGLVKRDHSQRLYMLLVLSIWAKWLGGLNQGR